MIQSINSATSPSQPLKKSFTVKSKLDSHAKQSPAETRSSINLLPPTPPQKNSSRAPSITTRLSSYISLRRREGKLHNKLQEQLDPHFFKQRETLSEYFQKNFIKENVSLKDFIPNNVLQDIITNIDKIYQKSCESLTSIMSQKSPKTIKSILLDFFKDYQYKLSIIFEPLKEKVIKSNLTADEKDVLEEHISEQSESFFDIFIPTILNCFQNQNTKMNFILALYAQSSFLNDEFSANSIDKISFGLKQSIQSIFKYNDSNKLIRPAINQGSIVTFRDKNNYFSSRRYKITDTVKNDQSTNLSLTPLSYLSSNSNTKSMTLSNLLKDACSLELKDGRQLIDQQISSFEKKGSDYQYLEEHDNELVTRSKDELLSNFGFLKKRTINTPDDLVTIISNKKPLGMGISKKVLRGVSCEKSKQEYAVSKFKIDTWPALCQLIKEYRLTNCRTISYDGKKRNVISIEPFKYNSSSDEFNTVYHEDLKRFFKECWAALRSLHQKGIIHNDFKLPNIVLNQELGVELIDFGLSFSINNKSFLSAVILSEQLGGTFCPQTLLRVKPNQGSFVRDATPRIGIKKLTDLTDKFKKSIDLWAFVMQLLDAIKISPVGMYSFYTANTLHKKLKNLKNSQKLTSIHPDLYEKVLKFLALKYDDEGYVIKTNGEPLKTNGQYDIPNEHWDLDSWNHIFTSS